MGRKHGQREASAVITSFGARWWDAAGELQRGILSGYCCYGSKLDGDSLGGDDLGAL